MTCLLIGQDNLLIQCAKFLIERDHHIKWVVTPVQSIQSFCEEHHIPWVSTLNELPSEKENCVDYLFSIVNGTILTKENLKIARVASINYHDALLPKYAGVNATTWSILNGETSHGITWHLINEGIDQGEIVYQSPFFIEPDETALTLNLRCFEEAVKGFVEIITTIETASLTTQKQQQENRSYYGINHVLPNMGFINWQTMDAYSILSTHRALNFGNYSNNVGVLKIYLHHTFLIVLEAQVSTQAGKIQNPGIILAIEKEGLLVSTQSTSILIKKLRAIDGTEVNAHDLTQRYGLHVNDKLPEVEEAFLQKNTPVYKKALRSESHWLRQLAQITDHSFFSARMFDKKEGYRKLPPIHCKNHSPKPTYKHEVYLLASVMVYLYRINNYEPFTLFWNNPPISALFSTLLPLSATAFQSDLKICQLLELVNSQFDLLDKHDTYLNDVFVRQPALPFPNSEYLITIGLRHDTISIEKNALIHFELDSNTGALTIYHRLNQEYQGGTLNPLIEHMPEHIHAIFRVMLTEPNTLLHQFSFLGEEEQTELVHWSVGEYLPLPSNTITELFENHVNYSPDRTVLYEKGLPLTYHQLWLKAEKITAFIQSLHLAPQSLIGISVEPSAHLLALILGIFKTGCVCIPISPKSNLSFEELSKRLNKPIYPIEAMREKESVYEEVETNCINLSVTKQPCILFASEHATELFNQKQIINYSHWLANTTDFDSQSVVNIHSSTPLNLLITSMLSSLLVGGTLDFTDLEQSTTRYLNHLNNKKISHLRIAAKQWESFLDYQEMNQLEALRHIVLTDEISDADQIGKWISINPECRFVVVE